MGASRSEPGYTSINEAFELLKIKGPQETAALFRCVARHSTALKYKSAPEAVPVRSRLKRKLLKEETYFLAFLAFFAVFFTAFLAAFFAFFAAIVIS